MSARIIQLPTAVVLFWATCRDAIVTNLGDGVWTCDEVEALATMLQAAGLYDAVDGNRLHERAGCGFACVRKQRDGG